MNFGDQVWDVTALQLQSLGRGICSVWERAGGRVRVLVLPWQDATAGRSETHLPSFRLTFCRSPLPLVVKKIDFAVIVEVPTPREWFFPLHWAYVLFKEKNEITVGGEDSWGGNPLYSGHRRMDSVRENQETPTASMSWEVFVHSNTHRSWSYAERPRY